MNLFDSLQSSAVDTVLNTMGYVATWKRDGQPDVLGKVLLNRPTQKDTISDIDYDAISPRMEYKEGEFLGLFDFVRGNNTAEIWVGGYKHFAFKAERKYDGKTVIVHLTPGEQ